MLLSVDTYSIGAYQYCHVDKSINNRCIRGVLSDKCVILVTHQLQYVQQCDGVIVLKEVSIIHACNLI